MMPFVRGLLVLVGVLTSNMVSAMPLSPLKRELLKPPTNYLHYVDVLGGESRSHIRGKFGYFADMGGLLTMKFSKGSSACTGYLIGEEWVLTASHCVYDAETGEPAQEIVFDVALIHRNDYTHPREYASEFWILKDTINLVRSGRSIIGLSPTWEYMEKDFAVVRIPAIQGRHPILGYPLRLKVARSPEKTVYMQTAGYPSDKGSGTYWFTECHGDKNPNYELFDTQCDAVPGQSGSAAVQIWSPEELAGIDTPVPHKPVLIGVISAVSSQATYVAALTQSLIDEIHGLIGITNNSSPSLKRFQLKKSLENRLFVDNRCDRTISVFVQQTVKVNGTNELQFKGWDIPAGVKSQLLSSTFANLHIFLRPEENRRVKLYRQVDEYNKPILLGPLKKIPVEDQQRRFEGYDYELGKIWTDSRLILDCQN